MVTTSSVDKRSLQEERRACLVIASHQGAAGVNKPSIQAMMTVILQVLSKIRQSFPATANNILCRMYRVQTRLEIL
ncbi:uncharacterized protein LOC124776898 isoform X4 [Schistocerca piceifrons]|uniref:uncharacterized protein LOC124776898 isoform X4 n=1 Tax=Schistocerca piceifrons TaxID=274613 RepID=UPI001F5E7416|nr:uncharacterized protein LOC124776898 isoform X4 [Schistocerca piceifrons]